MHERNRRIDAVFAQALELPASERAGFLREACGDDAALRREVEELLASAELEDTFLEPGGAASPALLEDLMPAARTAPGTTIDRYRLVEEIGRGGMGVVYLAERADGHFDQRVALKLLRVDSDPAAFERFSRERQILASLEHPRIARLIDGGLAPSGQPFLVMEYVAGLPIDEYCRRHALGLRQRIALLLDVCDAVAAAHRQLVVHRDLKPSNILVRDDGEVRLLDFGIAKLLDQEPGDQTQTVGRLLTPQYASPEQVRGERITVASDVYQLGLLAYELLTGQRPYDLAGLSAAEAERKVCEEVPPRPSTATRSRSETAGGAAEGRDFGGNGTDGRAPGARVTAEPLAGDLDLIVLEALHKDPQRRYPSVEALRLDLERYLAGLPITARPDVWTYRWRKFAGRHRWALAAILATVTVVTLLVAGFVWRLAHERDQTRLEARRAEEAARRAEERQQETEEVTSFLIGLFEASNPIHSDLALTAPAVAGADLTARELLAQGRKKLAGAFPDQPLVHARLVQAIGRIYRNLELFAEAEPLLQEALALRRGAPGSHRPEVADSLADLGSLLANTGREREAEPYYRESLALYLEEYGLHHAQVARAQGNLANLLDRLRQFDESLQLLTTAVATYESLGQTEDENFAWLLELLGKARQQKGESAEAQKLLERSLDLRRRLYGPDDYWVARATIALAVNFYHQGRFEEAIPLYHEALRIMELRLGPHSTRVASVLENLAHSLHGAGQGEQTQAMMERALAIHLAVRGKEDVNTARLRYNLAHLKLLMGDARGAEEDLRRLLPIQQQLFGGPTQQSAMTWNDLGEALVAQGRDDGVEDHFRRSEDELLALYGPKAKPLATPLLNRGRLARRRGDPAAAEPYFRRAHEILEANLSPQAEQLREVRLELAELLRQLGDGAEADALLAEADAPAAQNPPAP